MAEVPDPGADRADGAAAGGPDGPGLPAVVMPDGRVTALPAAFADPTGASGGDGSGSGRPEDDPATETARVDALIDEIFSQPPLPSIDTGTLVFYTTQATHEINVLLAEAITPTSPTRPQQKALATFQTTLGIASEDVGERLQQLSDDVGLVDTRRDEAGHPLATPDAIAHAAEPVSTFVTAMLPDKSFPAAEISPDITDGRVRSYLASVSDMLPYFAALPDALAAAEQQPLAGFAEAAIRRLAAEIGFNLPTTEDGQPMAYEAQRDALLARTNEIAAILRLADGTDDQPDNVRGLEAVFAAKDREAAENRRESDLRRLGDPFDLVMEFSGTAKAALQATVLGSSADLVAREVTARKVGRAVRPVDFPEGGSIYADAVVQRNSDKLARQVLTAAYDLQPEATLALLHTYPLPINLTYSDHAERAARILRDAMKIISRGMRQQQDEVALPESLTRLLNGMQGSMETVPLDVKLQRLQGDVLVAIADIQLGQAAQTTLDVIGQVKLLTPAVDATTIAEMVRHAQGKWFGTGARKQDLQVPDLASGQERRYETYISLDEGAGIRRLSGARNEEIATALADPRVAYEFNMLLVGAKSVRFLPGRDLQVHIEYYNDTKKDASLTSPLPELAVPAPTKRGPLFGRRRGRPDRTAPII